MDTPIVLITGGGTGIGRALAAAFGDDGAQVVIMGRRAEPLAKTAVALGGHVQWHQADPQGITVNAIAPGFVAETEFTGAWPEERVRWMVDQTAVGRPGNAGDVAAAARYLASPAASFVTGQVLHINGGWRFSLG